MRSTEPGGNPTQLFTTGSGVTTEGITYDPTNNSLWLSGDTTGTSPTSFIADYAMDGGLISSFTSLGGLALALDYADGTLWEIRGPTRFFDQYDKNGNLLQTVTYAVLDGSNGTGAEFDIPEPAGLTIFAFGMTTLGFMRRRRG